MVSGNDGSLVSKHHTHHIIETTAVVPQYEVCHYIERVAQPVPHFNPNQSGDCFLCSSYAIIKHFCKLANVKPPPIEDVFHKGWAHKDVGAATGATHQSTYNFWRSFRDQLNWYELPKFDIIEDPPIDLDNLLIPDTFGRSMYTPLAFAKKMRTYLEAGYLAHVSMHMNKASEVRKRGERVHGSDHMVTIDGYRRGTSHSLHCFSDKDKEEPQWTGLHVEEFHVVCSNKRSPEPYWISVHDWMEEHGGLEVYYLRPEREKSIPWPLDVKKCPQDPVDS